MRKQACDFTWLVEYDFTVGESMVYRVEKAWVYRVGKV
jgi:hypothetical protein